LKNAAHFIISGKVKTMAVLNPPRTMFEVFEALPEGTLCQLINNQLIMSPAPTYPHQDLTGEILFQILAQVKSKKPGKY
jgi:hypothetical protein